MLRSPLRHAQGERKKVEIIRSEPFVVSLSKHIKYFSGKSSQHAAIFAAKGPAKKTNSQGGML